MLGTQPIANPDPVAREAAYATHQFDPVDARCWHCDCRPWGRVAQWPCGTKVPREPIGPDGGLYMAVGAAAWTVANS